MKKFLSVLLALMLAVLPAMSMADSLNDWLAQAFQAGRCVHMESSMVPGTLPMDEDTAKVIADLLNAIETKADLQKDGLGFALRLSGEDALTFQMEMKDEDVYVKSNLLGDDAVVIGSGEVGHIAAMVVNWAEKNNLVTAEQAAAAREGLQKLAENMSANIDLSDLDPSALMGWVMGLTQSVSPIDASTAPEGADPADTAMEIRLTKEQLQSLADALVTTISSSKGLTGAIANATGKDSQEMLSGISDQIKAAFEGMTEDVVIDVYTAGEDLCAFTASLAMNVKDEEEGSEKAVATDVVMTRSTAAEGITYHIVENVTADDETETVEATIFSSPALSTAQISFPEDVAVSVNYAKNRSETTINDQLVVTFTQKGEGLSVVSLIEAQKDGDDITAMVNESYCLTNQEEPLLTQR